VNFRLHPRLRGRIDPDDVLQDAWLRAVDRIADFVRGASQSPLIWFRMIVSQTLLDLERRHLGSAKRSAERERSMHGHWNGDSTSTSLAFHLAGQLPSPSSVAANAEMVGRLDVALQGMDAIDREILALRHFEELTNAETARVLELSEQAASARYVRAMRRLKQILEMLPGMSEQWRAANR
jgi:RNA polymerase sigma-70 factor (ECF subfamily)